MHTVLLAMPAAKALRRWFTGVLPNFAVSEALEAEYAQKYIALVGIIPINIGLIPLKNPFGPCVLSMCCVILNGPDFPAMRLD